MNSAILLLIIGATLQVTRADLKEVECRGTKIQINEEHQVNMKKCLGVVGVESVKELNPSNAGCFSRCALMEQGLIDDSGKPHNEKIMNMIDTHIPEDIRNDWKVEIEKCLESDGSKIDMSDDKTCASFLPLTLCIHMAFLRICNVK